jgi:hypothetical protein
MNPKLGDKVEVRYQIWYVDQGDDVIIEETTDNNPPFAFEIGESILFFFLLHFLQPICAFTQLFSFPINSILFLSHPGHSSRFTKSN